MVLCIDDEDVGLEVRKLLLEQYGYQVLTASDGPSGLKVFESTPVDAVVLDYAMPGMHGGQVAAEMRRKNPDIPIVLLSAYLGLPEDVTKLVTVYMTKGEGAPALLEKLAMIFGD